MEVDGIPVAQMPEQLVMLENTIQEFEVMTFIELGLYYGGLAHVMMKRQDVVSGFHYFGFELFPSDLHPIVKGRPEIAIMDVLSPGTVAYIHGIINTSTGHVLVFCDDGKKAKEMERYAPVLRIGDILMGHDYPGEISDDFLTKFGREHLYLEEVRPAEYKGHGVSCWKRTS